jgi:glycosyltransferase involved in cell wall biosynthesis
MLGRGQLNSERKGIAWISFLVVDLSLYKTTQLEILEHSAERGHEVYLFAAYSKDRCTIDNPNIHTTLIPLRYIPVITPLLFAIATTVFLPFYVATRKPRFIIVEPDLTVLAFVWKPLFSLLGIKIVLDVRSPPVDLVNFRRYLSALWFNASIVIGKNAFDGITTLTPKMKQELYEQFRIQSEFVGVWTSGVSTTLFDPEKYSKLDLREKLSLSDKFIVMYHGSLSINRGILESIKAIEIVKDRYPDIVFFVLGSGPGEPVMKKLVQEIGVQDNVIFHDPVLYKETPKFIAMSDVGLVPLPNLPMWRNQCPLKLLEYLAMKKVVIVTDIPANREVIGKFKCGIYVSSTDPNEIAEAIIHAYKNRNMAKRWGHYGRMIIEKRYSWEKVAEHLDAYLSHL